MVLPEISLEIQNIGHNPMPTKSPSAFLSNSHLHARESLRKTTVILLSQNLSFAQCVYVLLWDADNGVGHLQLESWRRKCKLTSEL